MGFTRYGTPEKLDLMTGCEECKQDRPLMKVTSKKTGKTKQLCAECLKKWLTVSNDSPQ